MKNLWGNALVRFVVFAFGLYLIWFAAYDNWLYPEKLIDPIALDQIVTHAEWLLHLFGFETIPHDLYGPEIRTVGVTGSDGVWIGDQCNGITLFALFTGFVLAFPGPIAKKLWFIPLGILTIHVLNVIRVAALAVIAKISPEYLDFNHTYTFTTLVYSYVFFLWYIWADKLSGFGKKN